jgi:hypothetical protein
MSVSVVLPAVAEMWNLLHKHEGHYFQVDDNKQQQGSACTSVLTGMGTLGYALVSRNKTNKEMLLTWSWR